MFVARFLHFFSTEREDQTIGCKCCYAGEPSALHEQQAIARSEAGVHLPTLHSVGDGHPEPTRFSGRQNAGTAASSEGQISHWTQEPYANAPARNRVGRRVGIVQV